MKQSLVVDGSDSAIVILTLNRPEKRNALSVELIETLHEAVVAAGGEAGRRVIIIRGNGPAFCAGLDLAEAQDAAMADRSAKALAALYESIVRSPLVTIAVAQGAAFGGGAGLVAACDLAVGADDLRIGFPEVRRGLVAALVTCLLRRHVNDRILRELILLGQTLAAERAAALGLIARVVPANQLATASLDLANEACLAAPGAVARTKRLLEDLAARPIEEDLARALAYHVEARHSAEAAEGIAAFFEKRQPRWGIQPK